MEVCVCWVGFSCSGGGGGVGGVGCVVGWVWGWDVLIWSIGGEEGWCDVGYGCGLLLWLIVVIMIVLVWFGMKVGEFFLIVDERYIYDGIGFVLGYLRFVGWGMDGK